MWFGRFGVIVPVLAIAGSLAAKKRSPSPAARCPRTARCSSCC
jgi:K+-transporting ATPase ATPase A chain